MDVTSALVSVVNSQFFIVLVNIVVISLTITIPTVHSSNAFDHSSRYYYKSHSSSTGYPVDTTAPIDLGTTIVAIKYRTGVVIGADSRTSIGGSYVSHRYATKVVPVSSHCVIGRSGSAADTQHIVQLLKLDNINQQYQYGNSIQHYSSLSSPTRIATWLRRQSIKSQLNDGSMSLVIAGYDTTNEVPEIYTLTPSGAILFNTDDNFTVAGSGSVYIIAFLDEYFIERQLHNKKQLLEEGDAIELCQKVINMAIRRDGSSGGIIRLCVIDKNGIRSFNSIPSASSTSSISTI